MGRKQSNNGTPDLRTPDPLQGETEGENEGYQGTGLDMEDDVREGDEPQRFGERRQGQERRVSDESDWTEEDRRSGLDRRTNTPQMIR